MTGEALSPGGQDPGRVPLRELMDMTLANVVRLNAYTTDLDQLFQH